MRIRPKFQNYNLLIGSAFHLALELWYSNPKMSMQKIVKKIYKQLHKDIMSTQNFYDASEFSKAEQILNIFTGMCLGYAEHYKKDRKRFKNIECEKNFRLEFDGYDYEGQVDMIYKTNRKRSFETKTASFVTDVYLKRLQMDNQVRGYYIGLKDGHNFRPVSCTYNVVRKAQLRKGGGETQEGFNERIQLAYLENPHHYFHRQKIVTTRDQVEEFMANLEMTNNEYQYIINNYDPMLPESWGTNDSHCDSYFKLCEYFELCTNGLDYGSQGLYEQRKTLHAELEV